LFVLSWEPDKVRLEAVARAFWYFFAKKKVQRSLRKKKYERSLNKKKCRKKLCEEKSTERTFTFLFFKKAKAVFYPKKDTISL
jgi:hypothetical protein